MDKEHARFVLRCFRPDGADAGAPEFAAALELAAADRELGDWLAKERASDAAFARAMASAPVPDGLRDEILAGLAAARGDAPPVGDPLDGPMIGALASVQPPARLRADILAAMERSTAAPTAVVVRPLRWKRFAMPVAAAAGIAFGLWIGDRPADRLGPRAEIVPAAYSRLPVDAVQAGFARVYESSSFALDHKGSNHDELFQNLKTRELPCPGCHCLPKGLRDVPALGCKELLIDGKRGSLLCFDRGEEGVVHLVIFRREDIDGDLPCGKHPHLEQVGRWDTASWSQGDDVFLLIGSAGKVRLESYF